MGLYGSMKDTFNAEYKTRPEIYKQRLAEWAKQPPVQRVDKPTNIARARVLGYKAKQGIIVVRVRVGGGSSKLKQPGGGRKPSKNGRYFTRAKSLRAIAEERAARKYMNCEVVNSYFVGSKSDKKYYEVILAETSSPSLAKDKNYSTIISRKRRAFRALTSAGKKHRGLA
ncbi:MAG: 50S ribosomal protein L15e [Candidatus Micrarchaeia archaeon]